jgi:hypothetical protein
MADVIELRPASSPEYQRAECSNRAASAARELELRILRHPEGSPMRREIQAVLDQYREAVTEYAS